MSASLATMLSCCCELCCRVIVGLCYRVVVLLYCCGVELSCFCVVLLSCCRTVVLLWSCVAVELRYCGVVLLWSCVAELLCCRTVLL